MPRNSRSKIIPAIYRLVLLTPGIRQDEIFKRLRHNKSWLSQCLISMCGKSIDRVLDGRTFRLYLHGMAPQTAKVEPTRPHGMWQEADPMNKARGRVFIRAFDEAFGLTPIPDEYPFLLKYFDRGV